MGCGGMCHECRKFTCECPLDDSVLEELMGIAANDIFWGAYLPKLVAEIRQNRQAQKDANPKGNMREIIEKMRAALDADIEKVAASMNITFGPYAAKKNDPA